ncbi:MAG: alpha/beta hydrolase [Clostridia bacterium]|nr:alpha/beta hydrolase [Clostridia bacterium]
MKLPIKPRNCISEYIRIPISERRSLRMLIVKPQNSEKREPTTGVLWLHGGGYMSGFPELVYSGRAIDLVTKAGAVVVSPAYKLSIYKPYPAALQDSYAALLYMKEHCGELGIRPDQLMLGGESAGGGLVAALCMYAKDRGEVNIAFQMPLYPMLDCYDTPTSANAHFRGWGTIRNHLAWKLYLRSIRGQAVPEYASPSRRSDYSGLPPAYSFVGDLDPFSFETQEYIENLRRAGVEADMDVHHNFFHANDIFRAKSAEAKRAAEALVERFKAAVERYHAPQND